jgi:uncharacterized protein (UPF0335 family)
MSQNRFILNISRIRRLEEEAKEVDRELAELLPERARRYDLKWLNGK